MSRIATWEDFCHAVASDPAVQAVLQDRQFELRVMNRYFTLTRGEAFDILEDALDNYKLTDRHGRLIDRQALYDYLSDERSAREDEAFINLACSSVAGELARLGLPA